MKRTSIILCAALFGMCALSNCASSGAEQKAQLTSLANLAITAAEIGGVINPTQAALVRKGGVLVLDQIGSGKQPDLQVISASVIDYAESAGKLTPEQAEALRKAGTVPLVPPPGAGI